MKKETAQRIGRFIRKWGLVILLFAPLMSLGGIQIADRLLQGQITRMILIYLVTVVVVTLPFLIIYVKYELEGLSTGLQNLVPDELPGTNGLPREEPDPPKRVNPGVIPQLTFAVSILVSLLTAGLVQAYEHLRQLSEWPSAPSTAAMALLAGGVFFYLRSKVRALYGLIEIVIGCVVAWFTFSTEARLGDVFNRPDFPTLSLTFLTASVYLIVRGMDNVDQGIKLTDGKYPDSFVNYAIKKAIR